MKLALHTCCAPCLIEPYDDLVDSFSEIVVVYANPNIHPAAEYRRRMAVACEYAARLGAEFRELPYEPERWLESAGAHAGDPDRRCRACYRLRIGAVSEWAARNGCDAVATTLSVSPYQDAAAIAEEGESAARAHGVTFLSADYRDRYQEATRRSREMGMYRQNYCGCVMSALEAARQRRERRSERARQQR